jgi:hypothetical protein
LERHAQFAGRRFSVVVADLQVGQVGSGKSLTSLKAGHYIPRLKNVGAPTFKVIL